MITGKAPVVFTAALAAALISGGCATKKHVREAIAPVQQQVNAVQKQANDNKTAIGDLDRQVSAADEKATDAGKRAGQAMDAANGANQAALQAGQRADAANSAALQAQSTAQQANSRLDHTIQNLDNYKLVDTKQVFFRTGRFTLDKDAQTELDNALQSLGNMHNYVIEIEGFADRTGNKAMNLELSRKRADSVVRYLTVDHNVPLRDIRQLGIGSDFPNAVNKTRADRKENRRVDIKVYALDVTGGQASANQQPTSPNTAERSAHPQQQ
jgi:outer membrane protein OmpA-like peptidoglycan-associated protein